MCMPTDTLSNLGRGEDGSPAQTFLQEEYEGNQKTLLLKKGCRGRRIAYREIEYIESRRNVLLVFLENGEEYRVYAKLDDVEKELKGTRIPAVPPKLYCEYEPGESSGGGFHDDVRGPYSYTAAGQPRNPGRVFRISAGTG